MIVVITEYMTCNNKISYLGRWGEPRRFFEPSILLIQYYNSNIFSHFNNELMNLIITINLNSTLKNKNRTGPECKQVKIRCQVFKQSCKIPQTWFGGRLWPNNKEGIVCQCSDTLQPGK